MERLDLYDLPENMIIPYTYSFPLIRRPGLPREFIGDRKRQELTDSLYTADFEFFVPPYR